MAVCISLMFARLGGLVGAYVVSILLESQCQILFELSGSLLIGKPRGKSRYSIQSLYSINKIIMIFTVSGILSYFIPKIHQKIEEPQQPTSMINEPRASIFSARFK